MEVFGIRPGQNLVRLSPAAARETFPALRAQIGAVCALGPGAVARQGGVTVSAVRVPPTRA